MDEGFSEARVLAEVSLLPDKIRVASGRRAIAMAAGVVDRIYKHGQVQKQVLVVVTSGWSVMCFDHNLKKLWEKNLQVCNNSELYISNYMPPGFFSSNRLSKIVLTNTKHILDFSQDDFPHHVHHREIAISISNYTIKHGDSGLVIVGGRMEIQSHVSFLTLQL